MADTTAPEHDDDGDRRPPGPAARVTRRGLLAGGAALAGGTTLLGTRSAWGGTSAARRGASAGAGGSTAAPAATSGGSAARHATPLRGSDIVTVKGRSAEGRFGLMFKKLPAHAPPDDLLRSLARQMAEPTSGPELDNPSVTAGYTFFGQFLDHDMTLDRTPLAQQEQDPNGLTNYDSPLLDLGCVYGPGPAADPQLYEADGRRLRVVRNAEGVEDLPRGPDGRAHLGDARNDENLIVAQLHLLFLKFHNRLLATGVAPTLAEAQRVSRWHFQWLVVHEFLPRVVGPETVARFLPPGATRVRREHYKPKNPNRPMMPTEHSVAAYRFGHSMVRGGYLMNMRNGTSNSAPTFGPEGGDLRGSRPVPARFEIDWHHFFEVPGRPEGQRVQSRVIDARLSLPLFGLPPSVVQDGVVSLAERNLLRAKRLGLSSGQAVARAMGVTPLTASQLALPDAGNPGWGGGAPLWFYVLREAEVQAGGLRLGSVGGRIVAEVILGILGSDRGSYLNARTAWQPTAPLTPTAGQFRVGDLVRYAQDG